MRNFPAQCLTLFACVVIALTLYVPIAPAAEKAPTTLPAGLHDRIVARYINGTWEELGKELSIEAKNIGALPAAQKADADYIRKAMAECRPAWWKLCKAGQKIKFRPAPWGHSLSGTYDPEAKIIRLDFYNGSPSVTFGWNAANMDNLAVEGELPFTKGETVDLDIWTAIGSAESWIDVPPRVQLNMTEAARSGLNRFLDCRGNICGAYYATPGARRLAIWNGISGWSHEYDKSVTNMSRKTVGALFAAEVLGHRQIYVSIPRPEEPPADGAESKMVWQLQEWIRYHEIPFAEDRAFRDALKAFATTNDARVRATGKLTLPNGLAMSLDPEADKPLAVQRDKWIKAQYAKAPAR
ncbi:MAG TPA: hypothetical protein VG326_14425 [Tepidisphaeraceae bacterium]|nr:hypothetical protein [Tepidisphaeraceae bacterium]